MQKQLINQPLPKWAAIVQSSASDEKNGELLVVKLGTTGYALQFRAAAPERKLLADCSLMCRGGDMDEYKWVPCSEPSLCYGGSQPILDVAEMVQEINRIYSLTNAEMCMHCHCTDMSCFAKIM